MVSFSPTSIPHPHLHIPRLRANNPVQVNPDEGNLKSAVFFVWGALCTSAFVYAYLLIPETKGLSLEQVDKMMEETTPRTSSKWVPHETFAATILREGKVDMSAVVEDVERRGSKY